MTLEALLRRFSVGQRMVAAIALLMVPMAILSAISAYVLDRQEASFRESVEESIHTLLPLTTLEHYLQHALVDVLEVESGESVPNFGHLTRDIDQYFSRIEGEGAAPDLLMADIASAQVAWRDARPAVQQLVEHVAPLHGRKVLSMTMTRDDLQRAIERVGDAKAHLARAVKARYQRASLARQQQLTWLVWGWGGTLVVAALLVGIFLYSVLRPIRELGDAARQIGSGHVGIRAPVRGRDELTVVAERFNQMAAHWEDTHQTLQMEASHDPLTGLFNRRAIMATLDSELGVHELKHKPVSVLMIDVDHFKQINDEHGHAVGDRVLIAVSARMRRGLREQDRLGRYAGDEFLVVLPETDREHAGQVARRVCMSVNAEASEGQGVRATISIGAATTEGGAERADALIERADKALYDAKQAGRGRVGLAGEGVSDSCVGRPDGQQTP